jgi:ribose transport system substrate-binding protein
MTRLPVPLARRALLVGFVCTALAGCGSQPSSSTTSGDPAGGSTPAAAPSGELKRIIIVTNGPDPFWDTCEVGAKSAEKDLGLAEKGFRVDFQRGNFEDGGQIEMLKQYVIDNDVAAVGISVINPESPNLAAEMKTLQEKGIKVITIDSDISQANYRDARFAYLGTDNRIGGQELGRAAKAISPNGANFAFFVGKLDVDNAVGRMAGFVEGVGDSSKFVELTRLSDNADKPKSRTNVESVLDQFANCNMLIGIWAYNAPIIASVVKDRKIKPKTRVVCFDAAEAAIEEMGNGNIDVMVVQNPYQMGYDGVKLMHALVADDQATIKTMFPDYAQEGERDVFRTELRVVAPDDSTVITKELFEPSTIVFKFSEFKQWLKERGLISS